MYRPSPCQVGFQAGRIVPCKSGSKEKYGCGAALGTRGRLLRVNDSGCSSKIGREIKTGLVGCAGRPRCLWMFFPNQGCRAKNTNPHFRIALHLGRCNPQCQQGKSFSYRSRSKGPLNTISNVNHPRHFEGVCMTFGPGETSCLQSRYSTPVTDPT
jgi:hypothetical protein